MNTDLNTEFLRSINVGLDAEAPERIAHFRPTSKSLLLLNTLLARTKDSAAFIVAPYGSGKSIAAAYALHLIENRGDSRSMLRSVNKRMKLVSPEFSKFTASRLRSKRSGAAIVIQGYCPSLPSALKDAILATMTRLKLGREAKTIEALDVCDSRSALLMLSTAREKFEKAGIDQITILWDEFGKHLESLVDAGRPSALGDIQDLAEFVSRKTRINVSLGLILHRGLLQYAGSLPQTARLEWTKVEGRFKEIQYIDDSKEVYLLISEVARDLYKGTVPSGAVATSKLKQLHRAGLFAEFALDELAALLTAAYPLDPATLYLLPRVSSRIAQNERTLFSFLYSVDISERVSADSLYDYFSPQMRSDSGPGGTYRQWLETESALAKTESKVQERILKTACLLALGLSGERARASRKSVVRSIAGYQSSKVVEQVVDELIDKGLLLFRRHADELSVWHGTDVDLRGRLDAEKARSKQVFDLLGFLRIEAPQPVWRPVEYNLDFGVRRYFRSELHTTKSLSEWLAELPYGPQTPCPNDADGVVCYVIPETPGDIDLPPPLVEQASVFPWLVLSVPREYVPTGEAALEVSALNQLHADHELIASDPLVLPEIQQLTDDARQHLQRCLDSLLQPRLNGPTWLNAGSDLPVSSPAQLRRALSQIVLGIYPSTPRLRNEMIVRRKPTASLVNSRKKLIMGILERSGAPNLGLQGNFPDSAMLRTILVNTGIYHETADGRWCYGQPKDITEKGLKKVWERIKDFFTEPSEDAKSVSEFLQSLVNPPFGVREGVLPILMAAGLRAFPSALSLLRDGLYVQDILPSDVELLCKAPERHKLVVMNLTPARQKYLQGVLDIFTVNDTSLVLERDMIRLCYDALEAWKYQLPKAAFSTAQLSEEARQFRAMIAADYEPIKVLFEDIPKAAGCRKGVFLGVEKFLKNCKRGLEDVAGVYRNQAAAAIETAIGLQVNTHRSVGEMAKHWASCFSGDLVSKLPDPMAKGLLFRIKTPYESDDQLIDSLSSLIIVSSVSEWDDRTHLKFARDMDSIVRKVEEFALEHGAEVSKNSSVIAGVTTLAEGRIADYALRLAKAAGLNVAENALKKALRELGEGVRSGKS
jgi:hypothetical protein